MSPERRWGASVQAVACVLAAMVAWQPASAGITLEPGLYRLSNQGRAAGSPFGQLSPEELFRLSRARDVLTFSFDHPSADVTLDLQQASDTHYTLRVFGTAWGSYIRRNSFVPTYSAPALVDFSYDLVRDSEADDVVYMRQTAANPGTIWFHGVPVRVVDFGASRRLAFRVDDELNPKPHVLSGSGYVAQLGPGSQAAGAWMFAGTDDWMFSVRAAPVPGPGCAALLGAAVFVAGSRRRRRG